MIGLKIWVICSLLLPLHGVGRTQGTTPVQIYIVNTAAHSIENTSYAVLSTKNAFQWWYDLAPQPILYEILPVKTIYVENPYNDNAWMGELFTPNNEIVEVYIIANDNELLLQSYDGLAAPNYNALVVLYNGYYPLEVTITHELGHVLYNLPDWRVDCGIDIMCPSVLQAYNQHMIGCLSLSALGEPCEKIYLPAIASLKNGE